MAVITKARSGLARSGATRSGYPIAQGVVLPKYALSGIARSGATRSNYHSRKVYPSVNGVDAGVMLDSIGVTDAMNQVPDTGKFATMSFTPVEGQDVVLTLGSKNNLDRLFGGKILSKDISFFEEYANYIHTANLIDYTWGLGLRFVSLQFTNTSVATIAAALMTFSSGYTLNVAADIGAVILDTISFTRQDLPTCLTQLTKRAGGDWVCDYTKVVYLFFAQKNFTNPTLLNAVNTRLLKGTLSMSRDLSQFRTKVVSGGGGTNALQDIVPGETIIPVQNSSWYPAPSVRNEGQFTVTRGKVTTGAQIIPYTGVVPGGQGGLVGPGAAPTSAPVPALASGAGVTAGSHIYAVTDVTAAGESIASPVSAAIVTGPLDPPAAAPVAGTPTVGTGPNPGSHDYAVTFVNSAGETTEGPRVTVATGLTAAPTVAPTPNAPTIGSGPDNGTHEYGVTNVSTVGETTLSPISGSVTTRTMAAPSNTPVLSELGNNWSSFNNLWHIGDTVYLQLVFYTATGEQTTLGPASNSIVATQNPAFFAGSVRNIQIDNIDANPTGYPSFAGVRWWVNVNGTWIGYAQIPGGGYSTWVDVHGATGFAGSSSPPSSNTAVFQVVPLTGIPLGDASTSSRNLYRRSGGAGMKFLANIPNNSQTTYNDTTPNASLGAAPPSVSTAYLQRIPLTNIPLGGPLVTGRGLYGTPTGGGSLFFVASLNATDTTYTVTTPDASLGAAVPGSNTANASQVNLTGIAIGQATVTARNLYRSAANLTALKLLHQIADNTTTVWLDSAADGTLGVAPPVTDTSGLTQPSGQVLAGSTTLPVAGTGPFLGGWAVIGNGSQVIRYTGVSGTSLTGIPASGVGAIVSSIAYNSSITVAPALTGCTVIYPIKKGDPINLQVTIDDLAAQANLAALTNTDGIQEDPLQNGTLGDIECAARGKAQLILTSKVLLTLRFKSSDINMHSGRTLTVNLGAPFNIFFVDFLIQSVSVSNFQFSPVYDVLATSIRFTFDDLLRSLRRVA